MTVVTSGFVFRICQNPENPDFVAQSPPFRCSRKAAIREEGVG